MSLADHKGALYAMRELARKAEADGDIPKPRVIFKTANAKVQIGSFKARILRLRRRA